MYTKLLPQDGSSKRPKKNFKFLVMCIVLLFCIIVFFSVRKLLNIRRDHEVQKIYIDSLKPAAFETSPRFLSIGLDDIVIARGFRDLNMTSQKLKAMIKYLSPGYLRVGGNLQDRLFFSISNETNDLSEKFYCNTYSESNKYNIPPNITLNASNWLKLNKLANETGMTIFFGLNALIRTRNGSWDSTNAETMIKFSDVFNLKVNWELGNEPNSFRHKFNEIVNATQMAKDFAVLRRILNKYETFKHSMLVGPDVTRPQPNPESEIYLKEFVQNENVVNKITWHQYYVNGRNTSIYDFLNPKIFDLLKFQISKVKEITNKTGKAIWLGETASAYGGGAPMLSDRFIGSFIWLDKLGLTAKMGVEVVMRQSIVHGNYSLLDSNYNPNPDWWISLIYKRIVGAKAVSYIGTTDPTVRLYVHCASPIVENGVVIFGSNIGSNNAKVNIQGLKTVDGKLPYFVYSFHLTTSYLQSKDVYCNGQLLKMLPGNILPKIAATKTLMSPYLLFSPNSLVFWIVPNVKVRACLK